jgi:hypothetical protein
MRTVLCRPGHLHTPSRVLSASSEAGLIAAPPVVSPANKGTLRLHATGKPFVAVSADVRLLTGGNPSGYANIDNGAGAGAGIIWKNRADAANLYRGYVDTMYLLRVRFPASYGAAGRGVPSTPRTLADGSLGFITPPVTGSGSHVFHKIHPVTGTVTTSTIAGAAPIDHRSDMVVLPDGRLVALLYTRGSQNDVTSFLSTDDGATWTQMGVSSPGSAGAPLEILSAEYVDDLVVCLQGSYTGAAATAVLVSEDGGATFTVVDRTTAIIDPRTCVTKSGMILAVGRGVVGVGAVYPIAPGGGIGVPVNAGVGGSGEFAIATRDDGTIWVWSWKHGGATSWSFGLSVSLDDGLTFQDPVGAQDLEDAEFVAAARGYRDLSVGSWQGRMIMLARCEGAGATQDAVQMLEWGGWESITDYRFTVSGGPGQPYEHAYLPIDQPDLMGWTKTNFGAGATVTNQGPLKVVSTGVNNSQWLSSVLFWNPASTAEWRIRFRLKVISGGSLTTDAARILILQTDGLNEQSLRFRWTTTTMRVVDAAGATLVDVLLDQTKDVDWLIAGRGDSPIVTQGTFSLFHKVEGDATWTTDLTAQVHNEIVSATGNRIMIGGNTGGASNWELSFLEVADDADKMSDGVTNPDDLASRPLSASVDSYLTGGVHLGGRNGGGVPGDEWDVDTGHEHGKESLWAELRPSRQWRTTIDGVTDNAVLDAGAGDRFKGDLIALVGTNVRRLTVQLNPADAWGAPAFTIDLDATVFVGVVDAANRGPGFLGPLLPNVARWRQAQYRSDRDAHRWFVEAGEDVYEITDNDEDRLYVEGVDFSAFVGTFRIFDDRMGALVTFMQHRYMRLLIPTQSTADGVYRVGTPIFDRRYEAVKPYSHGFVDRTEPPYELFEADGGGRSSARLLPRRRTLAVQWEPLDRLGRETDQERRLAALYDAVEGGHVPILLWRDANDHTTIMLARLVGVWSAPNVRGELDTALTRVDQLVFEEEL